jgi:hypothetical protein
MRSTAITTGVLFWISNLATVVGSVIAGTIPNAAISTVRIGHKSSRYLVFMVKGR